LAVRYKRIFIGVPTAINNFQFYLDEFAKDDLIYYFMHRSNPEVRLLWAGHVDNLG
jgi:hypothetical protein